MMTKSGLGWDDSRCMVIVNDDNVWEEYVKVIPHMHPMRCWHEVAARYARLLHSYHRRESGYWFCWIEEDPPLSYNLNVDPTVNSSSVTKRTTTSSKKSKAQEAWPEIPQLVSMVTNFCDTANTRLGSLSRVLEKEFGDPDQLVIVLDAVKQLLGLQYKDCLLVTRRLVRDPKDMEFFFSLGMEDKIDLVRLMLKGTF
ncbi:UNVERIFIED_CONTAM: hypothetical protein Slati_4230000 [Sesamum latifolium]|uniref:Myb/SANT-like domain-containing protein n=1 Tax=Sesamum latifolium TaxID=2727402 RepID=A0AAW2TEA9_9LAMI